MQENFKVKPASGNLIWYLHTIRRHSMLRFHMKKKWFNFDSYLDKQRMHCNVIMRKIYFTENQEQAKRCSLIKLFEGTLAQKSTQLMKINSTDVFRFAPSYKKSKIYRGIKTATHPHQRRLTCLSVSRLSWVFVNVSNNCLRIHWFKSVPWGITSVSRKIRSGKIGSGIVVEWTQVFITC